MIDGRYRLLDATPLAPGEPESVPRTPRRRKPRRKAGMGTARTEAPAATSDRRPTYADLGRAVVDRLIELGRETGEALGSTDNLRREVKENRAARIDAEQRATRYFERIKELEHKLEMAETNLRTVLAAARGRGATTAPPDNEMEAVLRVLKGSSRAGDDELATGIAPGQGAGAAGGPSADGDASADGGGSVDGKAAAHGEGSLGDEADAEASEPVQADVLVAVEAVEILEPGADGEAHGTFGE
jgi:hypothetical protein